MNKDKDISLVKKSFEAKNHQAPDIWEAISAKLDDSLIDQKVSESYAESYLSEQLEKAPEMWKAIREGIDNKIIDNKVVSGFNKQNHIAPTFGSLFQSEHTQDRLIKESFEQTKVAAPDDAWEKIANSLTTEKVWKDIADKIVVYKVFKYNWLISLAASLTLLIAPFSLSDNGNDYLLSQMDQGIYSSSIDADVSVIETSIQNDNPDELITELFLSNNTASERDNFGDTNVLNSPENGSPVSLVEEQMLVEEEILKPEIEKIPVTEVSQMMTNKTSLPIPIQPLNKNKKQRFAIQLIGGLERSWIADNQTRNAFDRNSIVESKFSLGSYYGVGFRQDFKSNLSYEINLLKGEANNRLGTYNNGYYNIERNHIDYAKIAVFVNHNWSIAQRLKLETGLGFSALFIQQSEYYINDKMTSSKNNYTSLSTSALGRIGPTYDWNNWSMNLSLTGEVGLSNIFAGSDIISSDLNPTNLMGVGLSAGIRYKL